MSHLRARVCGIYAIVNTANSRRYVGSSVHAWNRIHNHKCELRRNRHENRLLQNAWNKHGEAAFRFEVVELIDDHATLLAREQEYIVANVGGYNLNPLAAKPPAGNRRGFRLTAEQKAHLSAIHKGKKLSAETRLRMSVTRTGKKRPPHSSEQRLAQSLRQRGRRFGPMPLAARRQISASKLANSRLTAAQREEIRRRCLKGRCGGDTTSVQPDSVHQLACEFGVSTRTVSRIVNGTSRIERSLATMNRTPVESSAVKSIGFENGRMEIELPGNRLYDCEATEEDYKDFLAAPSKGKHLAMWRGKLTRVDRAPEPVDA